MSLYSFLITSLTSEIAESKGTHILGAFNTQCQAALQCMSVPTSPSRTKAPPLFLPITTGACQWCYCGGENSYSEILLQGYWPGLLQSNLPLACAPVKQGQYVIDHYSHLSHASPRNAHAMVPASLCHYVGLPIPYQIAWCRAFHPGYGGPESTLPGCLHRESPFGC